MPSSTSSSENGLLRPFDSDHVERPIPARSWRALALIAVAVTTVLVIGWESYWRSKGFLAGDFENSSGLWAQERRKATGDATVIIGSSRAFFDIDLDVWEEVSNGVRPVQLSLEGTSPRIFLSDLANDEDFHGLVIVGVTTVLFFTDDGGLRASVLDYTRDESPFQRTDHLLSMPLERVFAFLDSQTRPKRQMALAPLPLRAGMPPQFDPRKLEVLTADRNTELWRRVVDDAAYREEAKAQWLIGTNLFVPSGDANAGPPPPMPDEAIDAVIAEVGANIEKIRTHGGDVAFLRLPYAGAFAEVEDAAFPRDRFWDRLLAKTDAAGVTFHDYPALQGYILPEWSHLDPREAERYTRALVPIFYERLDASRASRTGAH